MKQNIQIQINQIDNGYIVTINRMTITQQGAQQEMPKAMFCENWVGVAATIQPYFPGEENKLIKLQK